MTLLLQRFDELDRAALAVFFRRDAGACVLQHRQGVQRDVRAGGGVRCRRQIVGVGFARDLEHGDGQALRHFRTAREPLGISPALQHGARVRVALVGEFLYIVELVEHQQRLFQRFCGRRAHFGVRQQFDQRLDVVAAQHRAEQLRGVGTRNQRAAGLALGHGGQEAGLHPGGFVHACGHTMGDQVDQGLFFASGRIGQQFDQFGGLLSRQRQRGNTERGASGHVSAIVFKHGRPAEMTLQGNLFGHPEGVPGAAWARF